MLEAALSPRSWFLNFLHHFDGGRPPIFAIVFYTRVSSYFSRTRKVDMYNDRETTPDAWEVGYELVHLTEDPDTNFLRHRSDTRRPSPAYIHALLLDQS
jgi:hypothetical protein